VTIVFPEIRARLRDAAASLSNEELQNRLWRRGDRENDQELGFDDAVLVVIDELDWRPPRELVGYVLLNDLELAAFQRLQRALDELVLLIGRHGTFVDALASGAPWQKVVGAARSLETLLKE
jgi:hypothetical protein